MKLATIIWHRILYSLYRPIPTVNFIWNMFLWIITGTCIIAFELSPWFLLIPVFFTV